LYKKDDPKEKQQKALPICILHLILSSKSTELQYAIIDIVADARSQAMGSCKYCKVPKAEQQQAK